MLPYTLFFFTQHTELDVTSTCIVAAESLDISICSILQELSVLHSLMIPLLTIFFRKCCYMCNVILTLHSQLDRNMFEKAKGIGEYTGSYKK